MSFPFLGVLFFSLAIVFFVVMFRRSGTLRNKEREMLREQILTLFLPAVKFEARQIIELLQDRTGGRQDISFYQMYVELGVLVGQGKLILENMEVIRQGGRNFNKRLYFLPDS